MKEVITIKKVGYNKAKNIVGRYGKVTFAMDNKTMLKVKTAGCCLVYDKVEDYGWMEVAV